MRFISLFFVFLLTALIFSCDSVTENDYYKFRVTSRGGGFYGTYVLDDEEPVDFFGEVNEDYTRWTYSKNISSPEYIKIEAFGYVTGELVGIDTIPDRTTTNITIDIYENSKIVKTESQAKSIEFALTIDLDYTFSTDNTDTSSTTTDTTSTTTSTTSKN